MVAAPTSSTASTAAPEARWDYGSSNDRRETNKAAARWDYGSTDGKRDVVDTDWDYGKEKGELQETVLAVTLLTTLILYLVGTMAALGISVASSSTPIGIMVNAVLKTIGWPEVMAVLLIGRRLSPVEELCALADSADEA